MSLILDALKRAEAERQRGQVPTLGTPTWKGNAPRAGRLIGLTAGAGALAVALGLLLWSRSEAPQPVVDTAVGALQPIPDANANAVGEGTNAAGMQSANTETNSQTFGPASSAGAAEAGLDQSGQNVAFAGAGVDGTMQSAKLARVFTGQVVRVADNTILPPTGANLDTEAANNIVPQFSVPNTPGAQLQAQTDPQNRPPPPIPNAPPPPTQPNPAELYAQQQAQAMAQAAAAQSQALAQMQSQATPQTMPAGVVDASGTPAMPVAANQPPQIQQIFELDYATRSALPKLNLSLHVYDSDPSRRFVVINGKRQVEGDTVGDKVMIQSIVRDGVECQMNEARFLLPRQL